MTPLLKRLEEKGFLLRTIEASNERQKKINLTPDGKKLATHSEAITSEAFCSAGLTKEQAAEMIKQCGAIASAPTNK